MTQKEKAIETMHKLDIFEPYIKEFEETQTVCLFEGFGGFYIENYNEPQLLEKIKEIESDYGIIVYAVTHELTEFGEIYDLLYISQYTEDWKYSIEKDGITYYVSAYAWNKSDDFCSEFGTIGVVSRGGGIARVA